MKTAAYKKVPAARKKQISESLKKFHANKRQHAAIRQASLEFAQSLHKLEPAGPSPLEELAKQSAQSKSLWPEDVFKDFDERTKKKSIFAEAEEIIYGDREKTYGKPSKNLLQIAGLWQKYLEGKGILFPKDLTASDAGLMMVLLKVAREQNMHKKDNCRDGIGYFGLVDRIEEEKFNAEMKEAEVEERRR